MRRPAYTRLDVDERRRRLLDLGADLFTRHAYDELSMAAIARAAGISKALLYHYFPSKEAYFVATLREHAAGLAPLTEIDPDRPADEQLVEGLDAFLAWVDAHGTAYRKLLQSAGAVPQIRAVVEEVRGATVERILAGLGLSGEPRARTAAHGFLWFLDGAILDWLEHRDMSRDELRALLLATLHGALPAAGATGA
jgi:AcrR family transcriptional regulator